MGVLCKYFIRKVMHFSHEDFMVAFKVDLAPLLGECGIWLLKNYEIRCADKGKDEKKKKARCAIDLINEYLENGFDNLGKISKYNIKNRFGPKKFPVIARSSVQNIYAWNHYAPLPYFQHIRKNDDM